MGLSAEMAFGAAASYTDQVAEGIASGMQSVAHNDDGSITITFTNGMTITTAPLVGPTGKGLQFNWDGTKLGVRVEGQTVYQYTDLVGPSGSAIDTVARQMAQEAETIAKGRATGYVFDTKAAMDAWLADSTHIAQLVLGDNLYIRATDVPDYWWDGTQAQMLETQKVDLTDYVKNTDYATSSVGGVIKPSSTYATTLSSGGVLYATQKTAEQYKSANEGMFIGKGTLENLKTAITYTDEDGNTGTFYVL